MSTLGEFDDEAEFPEVESLWQPDLVVQYSSGEHKLNNERERITNSGELSQQEKRGLYTFDRALRDQNNTGEQKRKPVTRSLYLCHGRILQRDTGLFLQTIIPGEEGEEATQQLLEYVQNQNFSGNYIHKLLISVKTFGELCGDDEVQERFEVIKPGTFREDNQAPLPGTVLTWDQALSVANTRTHPRDRALILFAWGSGTRPESELYELQYKHLEWCGDHYRLTVPWHGKTGERTIRVYAGAASLRKWIEQEHPVHTDPDSTLGPETYLWTKENHNKRIKYNTIYSIFKKAGDASDVSDDTNPRHFRRSRASFLAGKPTISGVELRQYFGWTKKSQASINYIERFREDIDRNVAAADGASMATFDEVRVVAPITCNHCNQLSERNMENCVWCSAEVDEELHDRTDHLEDPETEGKDVWQILEEIGATKEELEVLQKYRPVIKVEGGNLWDKIEYLKPAVEEMNDQNCVTGPGGYAARASAAMTAAAGSAAEAWARTKKKAVDIHPNWMTPSQMPKRRAVAMIAALSAMTAFMLVTMYLNGSMAELASGDPIEWAAMVLSLGCGKWLFDRGFPTVEEARAAAAEEE